MEKGNTQEALSSFRRGAGLEPNNPYAHLLMARTNEQIWRENPSDTAYLQASRQSYATSLKLDSRNFNIHLLFIGVCSKLGDLDSTLILYGNWIKGNPGENVLKRAYEALEAEIQLLDSGSLKRIASASGWRAISSRKGIGLLVILVGLLGLLQVGLWIGQTRVGEGNLFELALGVIFLAISSAGGVAHWANNRS